jgi:hypothetical protein
MVVDLVKAEHSVFLWLGGSIQSVFFGKRPSIFVANGTGKLFSSPYSKNEPNKALILLPFPVGNKYICFPFQKTD